jgi:Zn-dependent peptidase ImmA (M78 family)
MAKGASGMTLAQALAADAADMTPQDMLAHAIKRIERNIFKEHSINFLVKTKVSDCPNTPSRCLFDKKGCSIYLRDNTPGDEKDLRISLAHELGHIALSIDKLPEILSAGKAILEHTPEQEADAWEFAFKLVWEKSERFKSGNPYDPYIYPSKDELKKNVIRLSSTSKCKKTQQGVITRLKNL